ncbi:hypothetical protein N9164_11995 [Draconibacterium sp.]|nr:hypothetical protein [Draconibacterium sp.]
MKKEFEKALISFFYLADKITSDYTPPKKFHEFYINNEDRWEKNIKQIYDWNYPKNEDSFFKRVKSIKEIEPCLDLLETIFEPRTFSRNNVNDKRPFGEEEKKQANRNENAYELTQLYFKYRGEKEVESEITIESFSKNMTDFAFSNEIVSHYRAQLIGFRPKDFQQASFKAFKIQRLSEQDKLDMMNKFNEFFSNLTPLNIVHGVDGAWLYDYWITGKVKRTLQGKRSTFFHVYWDKSFSEVVEELSTIVRILRLGSGVDVGIRNFYAKSAYPNDCPIYDKWFYQKFGFGNYANSERKESGDSIRQFNLSLGKDFPKKSINKIEKFIVDFEKYKLHPIEQIDLGIKYYIEAFDANYASYCFTSLMMAFEALLNAPPDKNNKPSKEQIILLLKEITYNIENKDRSIAKQLKRLNPPNNINKAILIGKKIYSNEKQLQDKFNDFFNPDNGCFNIRNKLLHGNFDIEINKKIVKILPQLNSYIRVLITKIIELRLRGALNCDELNYYEILEKNVKTA